MNTQLFFCGGALSVDSLGFESSLILSALKYGLNVIFMSPLIAYIKYDDTQTGHTKHLYMLASLFSKIFNFETSMFFAFCMSDYGHVNIHV